jgi:hypothetical protein
MTRMRLIGGLPHEPDSSDWDDVCNAVGPQKFLDALFFEVSGNSLPEAVVTEESQDDIQRVLVGRRGNDSVGANIRQRECTETTDLPTFCRWETYGLTGMALTWDYALEYAGQLGHVAFRHVELFAEFETPDAQARFCGIWKRIFDRDPVFAPA